ncbi:MAG TPA: hypothetical protein VMW12_04060 [Candidatus Dormibacteraeota bacterium]|nr:hypothetical protein [Candidatus Dormibacteraeota bacterium]
MNETQLRAAAADSVGALKSRDTLVEWSRLPRSDSAAMGAFFQKIIGRDATLSPAEIAAMSALIRDGLHARIEKVRQQDSMINHVGTLTMMQQAC